MLNTNSSKPLYDQLKQLIKNDIISGVYRPGERMPSEAELCERYEVSRVTVRRALKELAGENLLEGRQGKGTYVANQKQKKSMDNIRGYSDEMSRSGRTSRRLVLEKGLIPSEEPVAQRLGVAPGDPVIRLRRVMYDGAAPLMLDTAYYSAYRFPELLTRVQDDVSTYRRLEEEYGIVLSKAYREFDIELCSLTDSRVLMCAPGDPLFSIFKVAYDQYGEPVHAARSLVLSSRSTYVVTVDESAADLHIKMKE